MILKILDSLEIHLKRRVEKIADVCIGTVTYDRLLIINNRNLGRCDLIVRNIKNIQVLMQNSLK